MTQSISTNTFGVARFVVSADATQGTHTTIQGAINSSSSGDNIYILSGTYTENITPIAGINILGAKGDGVTPTVTIIGNLTYTGVGNATISEVRLQTNSGFLTTVSGSNASVLHILDCDLHCTNNTGISFTNSNAASQILIESCTGNLTTTGIAYHSSSSAGTLTYRYTTLNNTGASTTAATNSAGAVVITYGIILSPLSCSGAGTIETDYSYVDCSALNVTALTTAGTGNSEQRFSNFLAGTASAISIGTGTTVRLYKALINSTNTNSITGAGTLKYSSVVFTNTSNTINVTTQTPIPLTVQQGGTFSSSFVAYTPVCGGTTTTGALQSVASTGTSGQVLTSNGAGALPTFQAAGANAFSSITVQVFTSSGTYTPTSGMLYCIIELVGAGGGGGGVVTGGVGTSTTASGGGAGGYARQTFSAATIGASQAVTIGAGGTAGANTGTNGGTGGTTSVGALISATGGNGGTGNNFAGTFGCTSGGTGGAGTGTVTATGFAGGNSFLANIGAGSPIFSGLGGNSYFGAGGLNGATSAATSAAGTNGSRGGGGSGALSNGNNGAQAGGVGGAGYVVVTEFI